MTPERENELRDAIQAIKNREGSGPSVNHVFPYAEELLAEIDSLRNERRCARFCRAYIHERDYTGCSYCFADMEHAWMSYCLSPNGDYKFVKEHALVWSWLLNADF
jgi:hypothetical protein